MSGDDVAAGNEAIGLHHVAFCIGSPIDALIEAALELEASGLSPGPVDHEVTKSLYFANPDGHTADL